MGNDFKIMYDRLFMLCPYRILLYILKNILLYSISTTRFIHTYVQEYDLCTYVAGPMFPYNVEKEKIVKRVERRKDMDG